MTSVDNETLVKATAMLAAIKRTLENPDATVRERHRRYLNSLPADVAARNLLRIGLDSPQNDIRILALNCTGLVNAISARQMQRFLKVDNLWEIMPLLAVRDNAGVAK